MAHNKKGKQPLEGQGWNHAQIDRRSRVRMVAQECPPALRWRCARVHGMVGRACTRQNGVRWETMVKRATCHDCGTKEGQLHILGCDMELCPFCNDQLIICQCIYKKLGIDASPGSWAYSHGLTEAQQEDWEKLLNDKGRIPFLTFAPNAARFGRRCSLCPTQNGNITLSLRSGARCCARRVTYK